ncbi:MAG TPA: NAD(P)/FAD-dependent oxidoreductase [Nocardioidaceae bacterium]|nr:NAD(P)/FAD-dependent oxidoreductase [Nocardioidaceae bacterium]
MQDLLVAGGGPAGLATAMYAARSGLDVTVWEPRGESIDKACGEGLMPGALNALKDLGVDPQGQRLHGIRYLSPDHQAEARFRSGHGRGVRRTTLHAALRAAAVDAGVTMVARAVNDVAQDDDHVLVDGTRTRYLVAADGLHSPVRRALGLEGRLTAARRYGLRCHVEMEPWTSYVEVHWSPSSEAYVTPVAPGLVGVALLTKVREPFSRQIRAFPTLVERMSGHASGPVRGAGPLHRKTRSRVAGRVLLVGDASGYVDALTGEGVALALAEARAAVGALAAGRPKDYERCWRQITWRYRLLTSALVTSTRVPVLRRGLVPAAGALPGVFAAAVNQLARPA